MAQKSTTTANKSASASTTAQAQTSASASTTAQAQTQKPVCAVCGKPLAMRNAGKTCGALCANRLANGQTAQVCASAKAAFSMATVPTGYVSLTGIVNPACKAAFVPISHLVKFTGGDRVMGQIPHAVCVPVYVNGTRYVNGWLATKAGLQALQTGNFAQAPTPTKWQAAMLAYQQNVVKALLAGKPVPTQPKP
jgi:hypothetical protein